MRSGAASPPFGRVSFSARKPYGSHFGTETLDKVTWRRVQRPGNSAASWSLDSTTGFPGIGGSSLLGRYAEALWVFHLKVDLNGTLPMAVRSKVGIVHAGSPLHCMFGQC